MEKNQNGHGTDEREMNLNVTLREIDKKKDEGRYKVRMRRI